MVKCQTELLSSPIRIDAFNIHSFQRIGVLKSNILRDSVTPFP